MQRRHKIFFSLFLFLTFAPFVHATTITAPQFTPPPDPIEYTISPESPGPNETVYIEAAGIGSFIGNSTITWQVNGKTVSKGVGQNTFSFTTGGVGTATRVHVIIDSPQGVYTHDFAFAPSVVHLLWEADTSVPPFYKGKPLYSGGAYLKVIAFPTVIASGSSVPTSKLSFQWSRGDDPDPAASGLGKNVYSFFGDQLKGSEIVHVDVYMGSARVGAGNITIPATTPGVVLYGFDSLRGLLLDTALPGQFTLDTQEVTLKAEPYYFSNSSLRRGAVTFDWTLNGNETTGPYANKGLLTLRQTGSGNGSADVAVALQNTEADKFPQAAQSFLSISFGQNSGVSFKSLFGL